MTFTEEELTTLIRALEDHSVIFAWAEESETEHQDLQHYRDLQALKKRFEQLLQKKTECKMEVNILEPEADKKISAKQVREMLGGISDMSLWRYLNHPDCADMNFPKPIYIKKRRYWSSEELSLWLKQLPRQYVQKASS
jgi:predicted DNA-binding transcriptional regulator AlpA